MVTTMALYNVLLLVPSVVAHMELSWPYPLHSKFDPANHGSDQIDWSMTSPLAADGSDFPCKGYQNGPLRTTASYTPGQQYNISLAGSAPHMGGSCQISLSYDHGATFRVIKSMIGGCPLTHDYDFTVPSYAPPGEALLAWTWQNSAGNREFYMNCAAVQVENAPPSSASRRRQSKRRGESFTTFEDLPFIWKANMPSVTPCTTSEREQPVYPQPGPDVQYGAGLTKESVATSGDCDDSEPYGRTYHPLKRALSNNTAAAPAYNAASPVSDTSDASEDSAAPADAAVTPAPTTKEDGLLDNIGSLLGLGNGLGFTHRTVHTSYTNGAAESAAQSAAEAATLSEISSIMSELAPLLTMFERDEDATMTMTVTQQVTQQVTAPAMAPTATGGVLDGLLGNVLTGIVKKDAPVETGSAVPNTAEKNAGDPLAEGLLSPVLGSGLASMVFEGETTAAFMSGASPTGNSNGIVAPAGLGGLLAREPAPQPATPVDIPGVMTFDNTMTQIPAVISPFVPLLGLASKVLRDAAPTPAPGLNINPSTGQNDILQGALEDLGMETILPDIPIRRQATAAAPAATSTSGLNLDSALEPILAIIKRDSTAAAPAATSTSGLNLDSILEPVMAIIKRDSTAAAPASTATSGLNLDSILEPVMAIIKRDSTAAAPASTATSGLNLDSILEPVMAIIKRDVTASTPAAAATVTPGINLDNLLNPVMSMLGARDAKPTPNADAVAPAAAASTMQTQVRPAAKTAPVRREAEDLSSSSDDASAPASSTTTVTVDCPPATITVYITASPSSMLTITSTTGSPSFYTTSAGPGACTGTSALCPCAQGYECLEQGACTWVCMAQPTTFPASSMTASTVPLSISASSTASPIFASTSSTAAPASTAVNTAMPTSTPNPGAHPSYASADNTDAYLPCVPGSFICTSATTWSTCDYSTSGSAAWVYDYPRVVADGMACITFVSPYSSDNNAYAQQAMTPTGSYRDDRIVRARPDGECSDEGSIMCTYSRQMFDVCDQGGWVEMGAVANGTTCQNGAIVASS